MPHLSFRPMRSDVPGHVPLNAQVHRAGLFLNTHDQRLWVSINGKEVVEMCAVDASKHTRVTTALSKGSVKIGLRPSEAKPAPSGLYALFKRFFGR